MPATQCHNILAFVEGKMERFFVNNNFLHIDLITVDNGNSWSTLTLCEQIISKYKAKNVLPNDIVIWFDREENPDSIFDIANCLRAAFLSLGFSSANVHCLIPDRMSENIILADEELIQKLFNMPSYNYSAESKNGKACLKDFFKNIGGSYRETTDGVKLLKKVRLSRARPKSPSVDQFLSTFQMNCWWIDDDR